MPIDQKDIPRAHLRGGQQLRHRADYIALDGALQVACSISLVGALLQPLAGMSFGWMKPIPPCINSVISARMQAARPESGSLVMRKDLLSPPYVSHGDALDRWPSPMNVAKPMVEQQE